jgi:DNA polymerase-3 subunit epsilon
MVDRILITDTETQGLDPMACQVIEVAVVLYDVRHMTVIESMASLILADSNEAEPINRISAESLKASPEAQGVWARVGELVARAGSESVFMAHNASFDHAFYPPELSGLLPWICSKDDIEWPHCKIGSSCVNMALAHGVPVVSAHRALTDCMLIAMTLQSVQREGCDLQTMLARAMRPKAKFRVTAQGFNAERNALCKEHGFRWNKPHWVRRMAIEDAPLLPFDVKELREDEEAATLEIRSEYVYECVACKTRTPMTYPLPPEMLDNCGLRIDEETLCTGNWLLVG